MRRALLAAAFVWAAFVWLGCVALLAHDIGSTPITWNREISRLIYDRCASCHRPGGSAFSLMTYSDVQPRAVAVRDAVLSRRMPPWGAVKGFGNFRNDQALTQEQIELIVSWVASDMPRGRNRQVLPKEPTFGPQPSFAVPADVIRVSGPATLDRPVALEGLVPERITSDQSLRIVAQLPDGQVRPLVWLHGYDARTPHPFLFRDVLRLPPGTGIHGVPPGVVIALIPATK